MLVSIGTPTREATVLRPILRGDTLGEPRGDKRGEELGDVRDRVDTFPGCSFMGTMVLGVAVAIVKLLNGKQLCYRETVKRKYQQIWL